MTDGGYANECSGQVDPVLRPGESEVVALVAADLGLGDGCWWHRRRDCLVEGQPDETVDRAG